MMNVLPVLFKFFPKLESEYDCAVATGIELFCNIWLISI